MFYLKGNLQKFTMSFNARKYKRIPKACKLLRDAVHGKMS